MNYLAKFSAESVVYGQHCLFVAAVLIMAFASSMLNASEQHRPNIIILYADDLGYGDVASYNPETKIPTPHMDQLAAEGIRFTDAHSSSGICTPSRYALLTGRYHWRSFHGISRGLKGKVRLRMNGLPYQSLCRVPGIVRR